LSLTFSYYQKHQNREFKRQLLVLVRGIKFKHRFKFSELVYLLVMPRQELWGTA